MLLGIVTVSVEGGAEVMVASLAVDEVKAVVLTSLDGGRKVVAGTPVGISVTLLSTETVDGASIAVAVGDTVTSLLSTTGEVVATTVPLGASVATGDAAVTVTKIVSKRVTVATSLSDETVAAGSDETVAAGSDATTEVEGDEDPSIGGKVTGATTVGEVTGGMTVEDGGVAPTGSDEVGKTTSCEEVSVEVAIGGRSATVVVRRIATGGTDVVRGSARTVMNAGIA